MALLDRLKKNQSEVIANAKAANVAKDNPVNQPTFASFAPFAVANNQIKKTELLPEHRQKLLAYLAAIDETDPEMIAELLDICAEQPDKLAWALNWANKVLSAQVQPEQSLITCRNCQYFQCYNAHGGGAGKCGVGITSPGLCWWGETHHDCEKYQSKSIIIDQLPG